MDPILQSPMPRRTPSSDSLAGVHANNLSPRRVSWSPDTKALSTVSLSQPSVSLRATESTGHDECGTTSPSKHKQTTLYGSKTTRRGVSSKIDTPKTPLTKLDKHSSLSNFNGELSRMISPLSESASRFSSTSQRSTKKSSKPRRQRRNKKSEEKSHKAKNIVTASTAVEGDES